MEKKNFEFLRIRKNILPFKIVSALHSKDTQLLLTSRKQKKIKITTKPKEHLAATLKLPRYLSPPASELLNSWKELLSAEGSSSLATFDRNMTNLRTMKITPTNITKTTNIYHNPTKKLSVIQQVIIEDQENYENNKNDEKIIRFYSSKLYISIQACRGDLPSAQEYCQMVSFNNTLLLIESYGRKGNCSIHELNVLNSNWRLIQSLDSPNSRIGYSCILYKKKLILYGGGRASTKKQAQRVSSSKLYLFSFSTCKWSRVIGKGKIPASRKNHACTSIGKYMFIYGGVDNNSQVLSDLCILDIKEKNWLLPDLKIRADPGPRSNASFTTIIKPELKNLNSYYLFDLPLAENNGFFLFGGLNNEGKTVNSLHMASLHEGYLVWSFIESRGEVPLPRHSHSACAVGLKLYVFGGRNDQLYKNGAEIEGLSIFNIQNCEWEKADIKGLLPGPRWGHGMTASLTKIFVFGGISYKKMMENTLFTIETDWVTVKDILASHETE